MRISIAHRLSMVRRCNVIYQLQGGRIAGRGSHDELARSRNPSGDFLVPRDQAVG